MVFDLNVQPTAGGTGEIDSRFGNSGLAASLEEGDTANAVVVNKRNRITREVFIEEILTILHAVAFSSFNAPPHPIPQMLWRRRLHPADQHPLADKMRIYSPIMRRIVRL